MIFCNLLYLIVAEMDLISHIKKGALSEFEVIHRLGPLSGKDDDTEAVWEGPINITVSWLTMGPNQLIVLSRYPNHFHCLGSSRVHRES